MIIADYRDIMFITKDKLKKTLQQNDKVTK